VPVLLADAVLVYRTEGKALNKYVDGLNFLQTAAVSAVIEIWCLESGYSRQIRSLLNKRT